MTYEQASQYLIDSYKFGHKQGFGALKGVLERLGNPQNELKIIHVAGTNGKGSVCTMLSSVLRAAGFRVGVYTSPHLVRFNERFTINGVIIPDRDFADGMAAVAAASEAFLEPGVRLSYFEILTVIGFWYFARQNVDYAIIEVGIGGRLDATNVTDKTLLSVITSVGLDHMDILGDQIEQIAVEKAGIIKKNSNAVLYFSTEAVYNVVSEICKERNAILHVPTNLCIDVKRMGFDGIHADFSCDYYDYPDMKLQMTGEVSVSNASTALMAITILQELGVNVTREHVYDGLYNAQWPGRMQVLSREPLILLDGAHNHEGMSAYSRSLKRFIEQNSINRVHMVVGILKDKQYADMLNMLMPFADNFILTRPRYGARAVRPHELYSIVTDKQKNIFAEDDDRRAMALAKRMAKPGDLIAVVGSLYLIGDVVQDEQGSI